MDGEWYQVVGDHFVCGVRVERGDVVQAAPVLSWVLVRRDRSFEWLKSYAAAHGWDIGRFVVRDGKVGLDPVIVASAGSTSRRRRPGPADSSTP